MRRRRQWRQPIGAKDVLRRRRRSCSCPQPCATSHTHHLGADINQQLTAANGRRQRTKQSADVECVSRCSTWPPLPLPLSCSKYCVTVTSHRLPRCVSLARTAHDGCMSERERAAKLRMDFGGWVRRAKHEGEASETKELEAKAHETVKRGKSREA